jgi:hypothetical protein
VNNSEHSEINNGFIRVEKIDGVWWIISPKGEKFLSLGVNHIEPHLWLGSYNRDHTIERYGSDFVLPNGQFNPDGDAAKRWIDQHVKICSGLGFNTFAKHTHSSIPPQLYRDQIYYVASLETAPLSSYQQSKGEVAYPDVFSADFEQHLRMKVQQISHIHRDSKNLLGYIYTDALRWELDQTPGSTADDVMIYPWVNAIVCLGEHTSGKRSWIEHLKEYYNSADEAARAWGISVSSTYGISWDYLARLNNWFNPTDPDSAREILAVFMGKIAEKWYGLHYDEIRKEDPNHLILGDKCNVPSFRKWILPALTKYVDVIVIQSYNHFGKDREMLEWIHQETGKPLLNGDGSFGFPNPHQQKYSVKGFRTNSTSVEEVADKYRQYLEDAMSQPYMIGWHHCGYLEQWDDSERGDVNSNENGFLDPFENEYTEWTNVIREVNQNIHRQHEGE